MTKLAPPHHRCKHPNCTNYRFRGEYCQSHFHTCTCGNRRALNAKRCLECWKKYRGTPESRADKKRDATGPRDRQAQIKQLVKIYLQAYKSGQHTELAEQRLRELDKLLP